MNDAAQIAQIVPDAPAKRGARLLKREKPQRGPGRDEVARPASSMSNGALWGEGERGQLMDRNHEDSGGYQ